MQAVQNFYWAEPAVDAMLPFIAIIQLSIAIMNFVLWTMENSSYIIRQHWNELRDANVESSKVEMLEAGEEVESLEEWLANKQKPVTPTENEVKMNLKERLEYGR